MISKSLFRIHQDNIIKKFAVSFHYTNVVEWGGVESDGHRNYFPGHVNYVLTNITNEDNVISEDLTALSHTSGSIECAICISVLQHVFELDKAVSEIIRVLSPGGKCLITNGYLFPICMDQDYYRLTPAFWQKRLAKEPVDFEVIQLVICMTHLKMYSCGLTGNTTASKMSFTRSYPCHLNSYELW